MMILGRGNLSWHADERRTDRYGAVHLGYGTPQQAKFIDAPVGKVGRLIAEITRINHNRHHDSEVGETVVLGEGKLFRQIYTYPEGNIATVGIKPEDGRYHDWLDSEMLYRVKGQCVELRFEETQ